MTPTITAVDLTFATFRSRTVRWTELLAAAVQDYQSPEICVPPNGDRELADAYRGILRDALPLVRRAARDAYERYCAGGVTTRGSDPTHAIGHGSWVSGPDGDSQQRYLCWDSLARKIARAARQPATTAEVTATPARSELLDAPGLEDA